MSAQYHPDAETLAEYALGTLGGGMEVLVAGHLTYCPECRAQVARFEEMGGASLSLSDMKDVSAPSLDAVMACLDGFDESPVMTKAKSTAPSIYPDPLRSLLPENLDELNWSFRLPGIHEHELTMFEGETVSLIRARPGAKMLAHTHDGEEATLILSGEMQDGQQIYKRGDVAQADHDHDHQPEIIGDETCVCLIVMSGKMKFTGTLGRALNILAR